QPSTRRVCPSSSCPTSSVTAGRTSSKEASGQEARRCTPCRIGNARSPVAPPLGSNGRRLLGWKQTQSVGSHGRHFAGDLRKGASDRAQGGNQRSRERSELLAPVPCERSPPRSAQ